MMPQPLRPAPAHALRALRCDDNWTYSASGTVTAPDHAEQPLDGTIAVSIVPDVLSGTAGVLTLVFSQTLAITAPDGSRTTMPDPGWMFSFVQDPVTQDLAIVADNMGGCGRPRIAQVPQLFYPGRWTHQTRYANRLEFGNGAYVANSLAVVGEEWVQTPLGPYLSWKTDITSQSPAMGLIEGIDWWTPELGAPVKFATACRMPDGSRMRFAATLMHSNTVAA